MKKAFYMVVVFCLSVMFCTVKAHGAKEVLYPVGGSSPVYVSIYTEDLTDSQREIKTIKMYDWVPLDKDLMRYIYDTCESFDVPYYIFLGLIDLETGGTFDSTLVSKTDDHGLCQINRRYFKDHCDTAGIDYETFNPYDPYQSVYVSVSILNDLYKRYSKDYTGIELTKYILSCYNRGETGVRNRIKNGYGYETDYSTIVLERAEKYREEE